MSVPKRLHWHTPILKYRETIQREGAVGRANLQGGQEIWATCNQLPEVKGHGGA